jgi:hypothetical protein
MNVRATSEPPPDVEPEASFPTPAHNRATHSPTRRKRRSSLALALPSGAEPDTDYLWEWGAFPQPSPRVDRFQRGTSKRGLRSGAAPMPGAALVDDVAHRVQWSRAKSEPAESDLDPDAVRDHYPEERLLVANATLMRDHSNSMRIGAYAVGYTLWFELAVLDPNELGANGILLGIGNAFKRGAVSYDRLLEDDSVLREEGLVIRLSDNRFVCLCRDRLQLANRVLGICPV